MSITACEADRRLFPLIEEVNENQVAVEIVSRAGTAFLYLDDPEIEEIWSSSD